MSIETINKLLYRYTPWIHWCYLKRNENMATLVAIACQNLIFPGEV